MGGDKKMLRYVLTVAGTVALMSTAAFAEMGDVGTTTKIIHRSGEPGMASKKVVIHRNDDGFGPSKKVVIHRNDDGFGPSKKVVIHRNGDGFGPSKKVVIKRHDTGYGALVTKKKIIHGEGMSGSSIPGRTVIKQRSFY